jgi:hypothetical protein
MEISEQWKEMMEYEVEDHSIKNPCLAIIPDILNKEIVSPGLLRVGYGEIKEAKELQGDSKNYIKKKVFNLKYPIYLAKELNDKWDQLVIYDNFQMRFTYPISHNIEICIPVPSYMGSGKYIASKE